MSLFLAAAVAAVIVGLVVLLAKHFEARPARPGLIFGDFVALGCAFYALLWFLGDSGVFA